VTIPFAGYLVMLLSSVAGVAFLVSLGVLTLIGAWLMESLEEDLVFAARRRAAAVGAALVGDVPTGQGVAG
jgi:ABC-type molybdate transport system permease subunit